jgi:hypothetical protein
MKALLLALLLLPLAAQADPEVTNVQWIVGNGSHLVPPEIQPMGSNNNDSLALYEGRLYLAWRSAPTHFASKKTTLFVMSSGDLGATWQHEETIKLSTDIREPFFAEIGGKLFLYYMELGDNPFSFDPKQAWYTVLDHGGPWSAPAVLDGFPKETMIWAIQHHRGQAWLTGYDGMHYKADKAGISVVFKTSRDGLTWTDVDPAHPVPYHGGVSEVGFDFDSEGNFWGIGRNEDGDETGFGAQIFFGRAGAEGEWSSFTKSIPFRYDSPRMFTQDGELYLVARRNIRYHGDTFETAKYDLGWGSDFGLLKWPYLGEYSTLPKRTSLYRLDRDKKELVRILDFPSASDTCFPSIVRLGPKKLLIANYSSPLLDGTDHTPNILKWAWVRGQLTQKYGTGVYLATLEFK